MLARTRACTEGWTGHAWDSPSSAPLGARSQGRLTVIRFDSIAVFSDFSIILIDLNLVLVRLKVECMGAFGCVVLADVVNSVVHHVAATVETQPYVAHFYCGYQDDVPRSH